MTLATPDENLDRHPAAPAFLEADSTDLNRSGLTFLETAQNLSSDRQWKGAIKAAQAAKLLRPNDPAVDYVILEAAANSGNGALVKNTRAELGTRLERTSEGLIAGAAASVAENNFRSADTAARRALRMEPTNARAWTLLAASYAGLGWFSESEACLDGASRYGQASERDLYYVGRATNKWAMSETPFLLVSLVITLLAGVFVAAAAGILTPFIARDIRVRRVPDRHLELANIAHSDGFRVRLLASAASMSLLAIYAVLLFT